ncbi:SH3 domain-containing protein [Massilia sp. IC2-477]|uniref:SH3 domain-containing protein n=1 Tax=Massilia sp. IC2-477 TaxID=2887198 RepID=UPI001D119240|nr:SH3 domain-containing protein [Massilia sp. IC2-477]MCC2955346.1 SH3 domain-containing protein [Massilia sp. IC2-477]
MPSAITLFAYAAGLVLTLCLAAWLTPRAWWRRANARAAAVLACGTVLLGGLLHALLGPGPAPQAAALPLAQAAMPVAGASYRVRDHLNLRDDVGVNARRLAVVPAGTLVTVTGAHQGDWWQVSAVVDGRRREGWASSLWLRRADERGSSLF